MKLFSFERGAKASYGAVKDGKGVDLGAHFGSRATNLRELIARDLLAEAKEFVKSAPADIALGDIKFLPVITDPAKIIAIGVNYQAHAAEGGRAPPEKPMIFTRFADSLVGNEEPMLKPRETEGYDFEVELCVIIGKTARRVAAGDALSYIAGYTILNDGTARDWQRHTSQFIPGKNFYRSGSVGPWMVTTDELPDASDLHLTTKLNGKVMQDSTTANMIFAVPRLIEYVTAFTPLEAGDMIATGTPEGVGAFQKPPLFLKEGDVVEQTIDKIGTLRNRVAQD